MQLGLKVSQHGRWAVVGLHGDLDMASAPALRQQVLSLVSNGRVAVALDLSDVAFLDSTGLGVIVACLKRVRSHDGDLCVICPERNVRRVFVITELDRVINLYSSIEEIEL